MLHTGSKLVLPVSVLKVFLVCEKFWLLVGLVGVFLGGQGLGVDGLS